VALISIPVLQSYRSVFAVLICVAAIDVDLLGLIWLWGLSLNSLTMISLVMAIGLVVDYLAHIIHYFMIHSNSSDPRARMANALSEVGGAVAVGGLTTFIGVLPLAFASSFVYRVFFKLFLSIVVLGILHGFVIAPVLVVLLYSNNSSGENMASATTASGAAGTSSSLSKIQPARLPSAAMGETL
jgi:multidrug efflux pump subunit AcrB